MILCFGLDNPYCNRESLPSGLLAPLTTDKKLNVDPCDYCYFKILHGLALSYLSSLISVMRPSAYNLRNSNDNFFSYLSQFHIQSNSWQTRVLHWHRSKGPECFAIQCQMSQVCYMFLK